MTFEVSTQKFSGPLQVLLELIEKQDLPITEVSLSQVTEDYLRHLEQNKVPPEELADFLVVASRLLYIKSKAILPIVIEEEEEGPELELQLKMYKEFIDASITIENLFSSHEKMCERPRQSITVERKFSPLEGVDAPALHAAFDNLLKKLEPFFALKRASMQRIVSVQERVAQIRDAIFERAKISFSEMVKGAKSKVDVVVSFLALLELMKQQAVMASQSGIFTDIEIKKAK